MAEPEWSGAHKGLCMYVARLLQPVWEEAIMRPVQGASPSSSSCRLPQATLEVHSNPFLPAAFLLCLAGIISRIFLYCV